MKKSETYSAFIKAETMEVSPGVYRPMVVTVTAIGSHEFEDGKKQRILTFKEVDQKLGLNITNWDSMAEITGKDDDDHWIGAKVELWVDKNVKFGNKTIPAIRIRRPGSDGATQASAGIGNKLQAWTAFQHLEKAAGKIGPDGKADGEKFKALVASVAAKLGYEHDKFQSADWQSVIDEYNTPSDDPLKAADIPF